tara:strand:+ start:4863 stop:5318 length:456 start_codon:yes stop_codon:yes gene_type:complete
MSQLEEAYSLIASMNKVLVDVVKSNKGGLVVQDYGELNRVMCEADACVKLHHGHWPQLAGRDQRHAVNYAVQRDSAELAEALGLHKDITVEYTVSDDWHHARMYGKSGACIGKHTSSTYEWMILDMQPKNPYPSEQIVYRKVEAHRDDGDN